MIVTRRINVLSGVRGKIPQFLTSCQRLTTTRWRRVDTIRTWLRVLWRIIQLIISTVSALMWLKKDKLNGFLIFALFWFIS